VLEVEVQGRWRLADPDYGVVWPSSVHRRPSQESATEIRRRLCVQGFGEAAICRYIEILHSTEDNIVLPDGSPLSPRLYAVERSCRWLIWVLPPSFLICGLVLLRRSEALQAFGQTLRASPPRCRSAPKNAPDFDYSTNAGLPPCGSTHPADRRRDGLRPRLRR
jgi:hypothetical protein